MTAVARSWWALCLKLVALLCFIGAFIAFMKLDERNSELHRLRTVGVVSRALVTEKEVDTVTQRTRRGRTSSYEIRVLTVRHNPKSTIAYTDLGSKVAEADLPPPLPESKDAPIGIMRVSSDFFESTKVGDVLTVVNTPYNPNGPELYADVRDFDPRPYYQYMGIFCALTLIIGEAGRRFGKLKNN